MNEIIKATIEHIWDEEVERVKLLENVMEFSYDDITKEVLEVVPEHLHNGTFVQLVLAVLSYELPHCYHGCCPDDFHPKRRDEGCVACRVIMEFERVNQLEKVMA